MTPSYIVSISRNKSYRMKGGTTLTPENELKEKTISARLHPEFDADLIEEIEKIPRRDRSRTYRDALRDYFKRQKEDGKDS